MVQQKEKRVGRTKLLLERLPAHRLADIFVASFETSFEERLSMLDAVDLRQRFLKATEIVTRHLQVPLSVMLRFLYFIFLLFLSPDNSPVS